MNFRRLEIFVIVTVIALFGIIYAFTQKPVIAPTNQEIVEQEQSTAAVEYKGEDGKNALELLKAKYQVESKSYSFGDLVTSINGVTPDANHFWAMYVNGQFSQVGASQYMTKNGDLIRWVIEEIKY